MSKTLPYRCTECGWATAKWVGRCGECQTWGTVEELGASKLKNIQPGPVTSNAQKISDVDVNVATAKPSGQPELDRVLGGGIVPGSVLLLAGEPGIGKSTLLLEVASAWANSSGIALYLTGEESTSQVRLRAGRLNALAAELYLASETELSAVLSHIEQVNPSLLIIDSIQTINSSDLPASLGGVSQIREVAAALIRVSKEKNIATILVGHVTKDGSIAGPRVLEHLVDVVLQIEGERHARLRLLRAVKNRFGPADEIGCFDLRESGMVGLPDPAGLFLSSRSEDVSGSCITLTIEGTRPIPSEIQALVAKSALASPRRATSGLDSARCAMVLAVLERRAGLRLSDQDVYLATVGGVKITEPAADLAIALALASARTDIAIASKTIAIGEVGLAGEVRGVTSIERRLSEAARLGYELAVIPISKDLNLTDKKFANLKIEQVADLKQALQAVKLSKPVLD
jgi:DNA repair protein RadA/Sms